MNGGNINEINATKDIFRQLKFVNDKQGNHIEANNFYAMEMKKHKEDISLEPLKGNRQEKFIFWINEKMSNFGQNYIKPILIIFALALIYYLIIIGHESQWLYKIYKPWNPYIDYVADILNGFAKSILPFKGILKEGVEFVSLIFNISFSVLMWQIVVTLKRYTRR